MKTGLIPYLFSSSSALVACSNAPSRSIPFRMPMEMPVVLLSEKKEASYKNERLGSLEIIERALIGPMPFKNSNPSRSFSSVESNVFGLVT